MNNVLSNQSPTYLFTWQKCFFFFLSGMLAVTHLKYGLILGLILALILGKKKSFLFSFLLGYVYLQLFLPHFSIPYPLDFFKSVHKLTGTVQNIYFLPANRTRIILDQLTIDDLPSKSKLVLTIYQATKTPNLSIGDKLKAKIKIKPVLGLKDKGLPSYTFYWRKKNVFYKANLNLSKFEKYVQIIPIQPNSLHTYLFKIWQKVRKQLTTTFASIPDSEQAKALTLALLINDKNQLSFKTLNLFRKAGLSHSLALSGLHLSLVCLWGYALTWLIYLLYPNLAIYLPRFKGQIILTFCFIFSYLILSRTPISLLRAGLMFFVWSLFLFWPKKILFLDVFLITMALITLNQPTLIFDISFQLSFLAVLGIYLLYIFYFKKIKTKNLLLSFLTVYFLFSLAATIFILPFLVWYFNWISLSLWTNLIWLPLLSFIILPAAFLGLIATLINCNWLAFICFKIAFYFIQLFLNFLIFLDKHGFIQTLLLPRPDGYLFILYYLILAMFFLKKQRTKLICTVIILLGFIFANNYFPSYYSKLSVFDVGQGQAILYQRQGQRYLIDGGGWFTSNYDFGEQILAKLLTYKHLPSLNSIFLTHPDTDHLQGLFYVCNHFKYKNFYFNGQTPTTFVNKLKFKQILDQAKTQIVYQGWTIPVSNQDVIKILHPAQFSKFKSKNDNSLVLQIIERNKPVYLICGDVQKQGLISLIKHNPKLKTPVLILPHHGSKDAFLPLFYQKVNPKIVIVSTGFLNRFNLPDSKVLAYFKQRKIKVYNTAYLGQIEVIKDNQHKLKVEFKPKIF